MASELPHKVTVRLPIVLLSVQGIWVALHHHTKTAKYSNRLFNKELRLEGISTAHYSHLSVISGLDWTGLTFVH